MSFLKQKLHNILYKIYGREYVDKRNRKKLRNLQFSVIANNCNGGVILHDLGLPFNSPFVNLYIMPDDYIRLLKNLRMYLSLKLEFVQEEGIGFPVGQLGDVKIYFQHYSSETEAEETWYRRLGRIDYANLFIMFTDRGCTLSDLLEFDSLDYKNKVCFTHVKMANIKSAVYIKGFEDKSEVGVLSEFKKPDSRYRYLDDFDYVGWFNMQ